MSLKAFEIVNYYCKERQNLMKRRKFKPLYLLPINVMFYLVLIIYFGNVTVIEAIKWLLYQGLAIVFPGYALIVLSRLHLKSQVQLFAFSYTMGYVLQIINYFVLMPLHLSDFFIIMITCEDLLLFYLLCIGNCKLKGEKHKWDDMIKNLLQPWKEVDSSSSSAYVCVAFVFFALLIRFFVFFGRGLLPHDNYINCYANINDTYFYIENTIAAKKEFPIEDIRWPGTRLFYHYFSSVHNAVMSIVTRISAAKLELQINYMQSTIMLVTALFSLLEETKARLQLIVVGMAAALFTSGYEMKVLATYTVHLYVAPIGFDLGLALGLLAVTLVIRQNRIEHIKKAYLLYTVLFIAIATGTKGPCAIVAIGFVGMFCLLWLLKRQYRKSFLYGGFCLLGFAVVYLLFVTGIHVSGDAATTVRFLESLQYYEVGNVDDKLMAVGVPKPVAVIGLVFAWLLYAQPCIFILISLAVIFAIIKKIMPDALEISSFFAYALGIFAVMMIRNKGASEMYFIMAAFPYAVVFSISYIEKIWNIKYMRYVAVCAVVLGMLWGMNKAEGRLIQYLQEGYYNLANINLKEPDITVGGTLRKDEYEAYDWIRRNTGVQDMLVTNLVLDEYNQKFFITTSFTERKLWLDSTIFLYAYHPEKVEEAEERRAILIQCYEGSPVALKKIRNAGVSYLINMKELAPSFSMPLSAGKNVFENKRVAIYKLK